MSGFKWFPRSEEETGRQSDGSLIGKRYMRSVGAHVGRYVAFDLRASFRASEYRAAACQQRCRLKLVR